MTKAKDKSLKDQNRLKLWTTIAVNWLIFYGVAQTDTLAIGGVKLLLTTVTNVVPIGLAVIITSVANGLLSADLKARLVFLRWHHALPGHRAFSQYASKDPRIDIVRLKRLLGNKFPTNPEDENRTWYRILKEVDGNSSVGHIHREFLFTRDYAGFSAIFLFVFGVATFFIASWKVAVLYEFFLSIQFVLVRQAAATYGARFVCTVLAHKAIMPLKAAAGKAGT